MQWLSPSVPDDIVPGLERAQFESVRREVPMLLRIAALNVVIIMAACAHDGLPFVTYGWLSLVLAYALIRSLMWSRILQREVPPERIPGILKMNVYASTIMISLLGVDAAVTFVLGVFNSQLLIPVSLCFGAMAIAHCLHALRPAAIVTLIMGVLPSGLAMIIVGDFEAQMVGCSMISVGGLMLRFVVAQHNELIARLLLEKQNHELANTDALTGIANRRAIMALLDAEAAAGRPFAVALVDLDGFKRINDELGHKYGDELLQAVAARLRMAAAPGDDVGRIGGDEFVALFRSPVDADDVSLRADALLTALCRPAKVDGRQLGFGASLGFALYGTHGRSVAELLHSADEALYAAKRGASSGDRLRRSARHMV